MLSVEQQEMATEAGVPPSASEQLRRKKAIKRARDKRNFRATLLAYVVRQRADHRRLGDLGQHGRLLARLDARDLGPDHGLLGLGPLRAPPADQRGVDRAGDAPRGKPHHLSLGAGIGVVDLIAGSRGGRPWPKRC